MYSICIFLQKNIKEPISSADSWFLSNNINVKNYITLYGFVNTFIMHWFFIKAKVSLFIKRYRTEPHRSRYSNRVSFHPVLPFATGKKKDDSDAPYS